MNNETKTLVDNAIEEKLDAISSYGKVVCEEVLMLQKNREWFEELGSVGSIGEYSINYYSLTHEQSVKVFKKYPGKFTKEYNQDSINYVNKEHKPPITIYWSKPPENCKIVEVTEEVLEHVVPAGTKTVRKIQCQKTEAFPEEVEAAIDATLEVSDAT